jgi:hypothetical protein
MNLMIVERLVTETLQPLPKDRKCFRLINGVLVERTIEDVLPALNTNSDGLKQVLDELVKQYKGKQDEMDKWKASGIIIQSALAFHTDNFAEEEQYPGRPELILDASPQKDNVASQPSDGTGSLRSTEVNLAHWLPSRSTGRDLLT